MKLSTAPAGVESSRQTGTGFANSGSISAIGRQEGNRWMSSWMAAHERLHQCAPAADPLRASGSGGRVSSPHVHLFRRPFPRGAADYKPWPLELLSLASTAGARSGRPIRPRHHVGACMRPNRWPVSPTVGAAPGNAERSKRSVRSRVSAKRPASDPPSRLGEWRSGSQPIGPLRSPFLVLREGEPS